MEKKIVLREIDELLVEGRSKVLSTKWDFSGTDIIGFGTYVDGDVYYNRIDEFIRNCTLNGWLARLMFRQELISIKKPMRILSLSKP